MNAPMRSALQTERIRVLERGSRTLVMDRISGRWVYVDHDDSYLIPVALSPSIAPVPSAAQSRISALSEAFEAQGLGIATRNQHPENLNTLIVKLTNACNLACKYCYDYEAMEQATVLGLGAARAAMQQALSLADKRLWVIFHGGEPTLLWSQIERLVLDGEMMAREQNKVILFTGQTNLTRLTAEMANFSKMHDVRWGVSFDGPADINDKLRINHKGDGTYSAFEKAYGDFPEFVRDCGVMSTVTSENARHLLDVCRHFHSLGMVAWDWSLYQPIGRARSNAMQIAPSDEHVICSWLELFAAVECGEFEGFEVRPVLKYLENFINGPGKNMCMRPKCGAARDLMSISADGVIEACDCIDPVGPLAGLGKISETTLAQARISPLAIKIRSRDLSSSATCSSCIWFGVCGGTCMAQAGSVDGVSGSACHLALAAFDAISLSLARSDDLMRYLRSVTR